MMKCPFCDEKIEDTSIKCNYCWETIKNSKWIKNTKIYTKIYKIWKKEYKKYVAMWIIWIIAYAILRAMKLNDISNIILFFAWTSLFYWTILRYHDLRKRWFYAFLLLIPIIWLFIIIDLISVEKKDGVVDKINYKIDTIVSMLIYLLIVLIVIPMFLIYSKFPLL